MVDFLLPKGSSQHDFLRKAYPFHPFPDTTSSWLSFSFLFFFKFYFIFKLYIIALVLPNIKMNPPQVYMCSPPWTLLPPHTISLGRPSALAPSIQYCASNLDWQLVSYMIEFYWGFLFRSSSVILHFHFLFFVASLSGFGIRVMVAS